MANMAKLFAAEAANENDRALALFINGQRALSVMIAWRRLWSSPASCCTWTSHDDDDDDDDDALPNRLYGPKWIDATASNACRRVINMHIRLMGTQRHHSCTGLMLLQACIYSKVVSTNNRILRGATYPQQLRRQKLAAGPRIWNSLPRVLRTLDISYKHFETILKPYMFD